MQRKKILTILGTRPEAIELAPVITEFGRWAGKFNSRVCVTAQHREVSMLRDPERRAAMAMVNNPYGDGQASRRIVDVFARS